jgi:hypothetical protein
MGAGSQIIYIDSDPLALTLPQRYCTPIFRIGPLGLLEMFVLLAQRATLGYSSKETIHNQIVYPLHH